jgi:hypothetical protein
VSDTAQILSPGLDIGGRVAFWLRSRGYSAKHTARVIDASEATGKRLRSGTTPTTEQMASLSRHFGWEFVKHVFEAVIGPDQQSGLMALESRLARLENWYAAERQSVIEASPALARFAAPEIPPIAGEAAPQADRRSGSDRRSGGDRRQA